MIALHLELHEANDIVKGLHRHHKPVTGHRFSFGIWESKENRLVGAVIVGRPVARLTDQKFTVEVLRLVTDGTKNACSFGYGNAAKIAQLLGYRRIQTFILESEPGTSLKAAGWVNEGPSAGGSWVRKNHPGHSKDTVQPQCAKTKWARSFSDLLEARWAA